MKKISIVIVAVLLGTVSCGGAGSGGLNPPVYLDVNTVDVSALGDSQTAALRDIGLYDVSIISSSSSDGLHSMSAGIGIMSHGMGIKVLKTLTKQAVNDSSSQTVHGINGQGTATYSYSAEGNIDSSGGEITITGVTTADEFDGWGMCGQIVRINGVIRCDLPISIDRNGDVHGEGRCYTVEPNIVTGVDGIEHTIYADFTSGYEGSAYSEYYDVTINAGYASVDGVAVKMTDLTEPPVCPNPEVVAVEPENDAVDVPVGAPVIITFSNEMDRASVEDNFNIARTSRSSETSCSSYITGSDLGATGNFSWDGMIMTFTPDTRLTYSSCYAIELPYGIRDISGYPTRLNYNPSFRTIDEPEDEE